ncbi:hypothetical protein EJ08DRAFT_69144 [Tothia fuscella]|uniref:Uncharacterized protein n=1 Tax=Tothia fuscella TaxID=1048955 RepID=A0A9P4TSP8_9PEZI|nr:hypothetical protein EJ08DRAFT_69144 [Tothia fuscella]
MDIYVTDWHSSKSMELLLFTVLGNDGLTTRYAEAIILYHWQSQERKGNMHIARLVAYLHDLPRLETFELVNNRGNCMPPHGAYGRHKLVQDRKEAAGIKQDEMDSFLRGYLSKPQWSGMLIEHKDETGAVVLSSRQAIHDRASVSQDRRFGEKSHLAAVKLHCQCLGEFVGAICTSEVEFLPTIFKHVRSLHLHIEEEPHPLPHRHNAEHLKALGQFLISCTELRTLQLPLLQEKIMPAALDAIFCGRHFAALEPARAPCSGRTGSKVWADGEDTADSLYHSTHTRTFRRRPCFRIRGRAR